MTNLNQPKQQNSTAAQVADGSAVPLTPGPWYVARYKHLEGFSINSDNGKCVAERWSPSANMNDAYLIAAAPRLYAALEALYNATPDTVGGELLQACQQARAALTDARGESEGE